MANPWDVPNLEEFLYYCCPECDHKIKDCQSFVEHALVEHEEARRTLLKVKEETTEVHIVTETCKLTRSTDLKILKSLGILRSLDFHVPRLQIPGYIHPQLMKSLDFPILRSLRYSHPQSLRSLVF